VRAETSRFFEILSSMRCTPRVPNVTGATLSGDVLTDPRDHVRPPMLQEFASDAVKELEREIAFLAFAAGLLRSGSWRSHGRRRTDPWALLQRRDAHRPTCQCPHERPLPLSEIRSTLIVWDRDRYYCGRAQL
jgi:hypothetical protein